MSLRVTEVDLQGGPITGNGGGPMPLARPVADSRGPRDWQVTGQGSARGRSASPGRQKRDLYLGGAHLGGRLQPFSCRRFGQTSPGLRTSTYVPGRALFNGLLAGVQQAPGGVQHVPSGHQPHPEQVRPGNRSDQGTGQTREQVRPGNRSDQGTGQTCPPRLLSAV
jgi:hypothetical protein